MRYLAYTLLFLAAMHRSISAADPIVYVSAFTGGGKGGIFAFRFDSDKGTLRAMHKTTDIENPFFLALSPDQRFLYAIDAKVFGGKEDEFVAAYAVDPETGMLRRLNRQSARGTASCYLEVDASGKTVLVANYSTGSVAALPIQQDGSLGEAVSFIQHRGSSVDPKRQQAPYAHCIVISPDNRFALAADLGIDKILIYRLDPSAAKMVPHETQPFVELPPGSGPRHLTFHPNGKWVYVINELKNTVTRFDYDAQKGTLARRLTIPTLPEDFQGTSHTADVKITPDGEFLYGTNRGHDSIAMYRIGEEGDLERIGLQPSLGRGPQNLLITPDGRWLLCANMPEGNVVVFAIDRESGKLTPQGEPVSVPMASCIRWKK